MKCTVSADRGKIRFRAIAGKATRVLAGDSNSGGEAFNTEGTEDAEKNWRLRVMTDHYSNFDFDYGDRRRWAATILFACLAAFCTLPLLAAQQQGAAGDAPVTRKGPSTSTDSADTPPQGATLGPPTQPVAEIIQKFAAKEAEFKTERENFTYTQSFLLQTLDESNRVDGEYKMTSDITFDTRGKRVEVVTNAPTPTLERLQLTQEEGRFSRPRKPLSICVDQRRCGQVRHQVRGTRAARRTYGLRL
jgi:hypothetical protein